MTANLRVSQVRVTHLPHRVKWTGRRFETRYATIRVEAILSDGTAELLREYRTPETWILVQEKIAEAEREHRDAIGKTWKEVRRNPEWYGGKLLQLFSVTKTPRWFRCECGATIKVSRELWSKYSAGEKIEVTCEFCACTETADPSILATPNGAG
jgi:hypothetical protein